MVLGPPHDGTVESPYRKCMEPGSLTTGVLRRYPSQFAFPSIFSFTRPGPQCLHVVQYNVNKSLGIPEALQAFIQETDRHCKWDVIFLQEFCLSSTLEPIFQDTPHDYWIFEAGPPPRPHKIIVTRPFPGSWPVAIIIHHRWSPAFMKSNPFTDAYE